MEYLFAMERHKLFGQEALIYTISILILIFSVGPVN